MTLKSCSKLTRSAYKNLGYQKKEIIEKLKEMMNKWEEEYSENDDFEEEAIEELDDEVLDSDKGGLNRRKRGRRGILHR